MSLDTYNKAKEKLLLICELKPPLEDIIKQLKLMYELLCNELGILCKQEIIDNIANDAAIAIKLSKKQIKQLLYWENN
jgi:hypothetical protein